MSLTLSVAIPCYNGAAYIGQTIAAVLEQTQPAAEILVIDDGSTDSSPDIIQTYPVQYIRHAQNKGLATARNSALAAAQGEIIVFVDVDAFAAPDLLETLATGYDTAVVAGVGGQGIESNIQSLADRWRRAHATQGHGRHPKFVDHLYGLCMSYRRSALEAIGGFDPGYLTNAEDVDVGLRLTQAGYKLRYLPNAQVFHQRHDDETSLKRAMRNWYKAGYRARYLNRAQPWRLFLGTARRLLADPLSDLLIARDAHMAYLSWQMGWLKLRALGEARTQIKQP